MDKSDKHTKLSPDLLEVQLSVISNSRCGKAKGNSWDHTYRNQITRNMVSVAFDSHVDFVAAPARRHLFRKSLPHASCTFSLSLTHTS